MFARSHTLPRPVLVVSPRPDPGPGDRELDDVLEVLRARHGRPSVRWYLRRSPASLTEPAAPGQPAAGGVRVVDDLRTWAPAAAARSLGLGVLANHLQGARLRFWARRDAPALVLLNGGWGERVLVSPLDRSPRVIRLLADPGDDSVPEDPPAGGGELCWDGRPTGATPVDGPVGRILSTPHLLRNAEGPKRFLSADVRGEERARAGLPPDGPVIVGWGNDPWLDGPDLLIRLMWHLDRTGVEVTGVWQGSFPTPHDRRELIEEAERCGVADRFLIRSPEEPHALRWSADVALLP